MKPRVFPVGAGAVVIATGCILLTSPKPAARLKREQPVPGADVIVLGQHVDYWNSVRWSDRFSQHAFSERQVDYPEHLYLDSPYTPQTVVDGHTDVLGSDQSGIERAIAQAADCPTADVNLTHDGDSIRVSVNHFPVAKSGLAADVVLAVTEDGLRTHVGGGENSGRWLEHSVVVRTLRDIGSITVSPSATWT